ncbi:hypothetical protein OIU79_015794 [Salix purpurea]|uniref:Transcriptional factor DELLA N-terminal domain-containing protein n=1 Tax=Salix purpurea TaxID=77065 RepID=A0A9Q0SQM9_SALPP|nr:hypothetical protein OIU79_015794 [Salix purpurea]
MKREHSNLHPQQLTDPFSLAGGGYSLTNTSTGTSTMTSNNGKAKTWEEAKGNQADGGMDELLAVLGYKVRSSDMAGVAQKLEQLEEVMGHAQEDGLSHLASDSVHYNPSNLSTWLESMISKLNPNLHFDPSADSLLAPAESSTVNSIDFSDHKHHQQPKLFEKSTSSGYDLKVIPGKAACSQPQIDSRESKQSVPGQRVNHHVIAISAPLSSSPRAYHSLPQQDPKPPTMPVSYAPHNRPSPSPQETPPPIPVQDIQQARPCSAPTAWLPSSPCSFLPISCGRMFYQE